jgi:hypothetical protein
MKHRNALIWAGSEFALLHFRAAGIYVMLCPETRRSGIMRVQL